MFLCIHVRLMHALQRACCTMARLAVAVYGHASCRVRLHMDSLAAVRLLCSKLGLGKLGSPAQAQKCRQ